MVDSNTIANDLDYYVKINVSYSLLLCAICLIFIFPTEKNNKKQDIPL